MRNRAGLGDIVARATSAVGIKPCAACKETQAALNAWGEKYAEYVPERLRERFGLKRKEDTRVKR